MANCATATADSATSKQGSFEAFLTSVMLCFWANPANLALALFADNVVRIAFFPVNCHFGTG